MTISIGNIKYYINYSIKVILITIILKWNKDYVKKNVGYKHQNDLIKMFVLT